MKADQIRFRFTANRTVVHTLEIEVDYAVLVVGDPDNAAYEWVIVKEGQVFEHSNDAYGMWVAALRDGLAAYLG